MHAIHHGTTHRFTQPACKSSRRSRYVVQHSIVDRTASRLGLAAATGLSSLALLLCGLPASADSDGITIKFKKSADPEIAAAQQVLVEAWAYVSGYYVDPTFGGVNWRTAGQDALAASFKASSRQEVKAALDTLLEQLHDPFTRVLVPEDARTFYNEQEGKVVATGLGLEQRGASGAMAIAWVLPASPAATAGIQEGDELLAVNGQAARSRPVKELYKLLKQPAELRLRRAVAEGAGTAGVGEAGSSSATAASTASSSSNSASGSSSDGGGAGGDYEVHIEPAPLDFSAVQYAVLPASSGSTSKENGGASLGSDAARSDASSSSAGSSKGAAGAGKVGYIRIITFTDPVPQEVADALQDLRQEDAAGLVLDLRDNLGGSVGAGVEVAKYFLAEGDVLLNITERFDGTEAVRLEGVAAAPLGRGLPLVVLVNGGTASTSELLAGALHDDVGAQLLGSRTFGKGRTQRVIRLSDGSALLVSIALYTTPAGTPVDKVGLTPDVACAPEGVGEERWFAGAVGGGSLLDDPCIKLAVDRLAAR